MGKLKKVYSTNSHICFSAQNMRGGISLGNFSYIDSRENQPTIAHEAIGHVKQSKMLGPLYLLVIGIPSITWAYFRNTRKHPNYYAFYTESWANKLAGLIVKEINGRYYIDFA